MTPFPIVAFVYLLTAGNAFPVDPSMKTIASAIKNGHIDGTCPTAYKSSAENLQNHTYTYFQTANTELIVFENNEGPACITEQWYTGAVFDENTLVRIYLDGASTPAIEYKLLLAHGVGFSMSAENKHAPWSTKRIGHNAENGGLFNTYRIPYQSSIKVTIETIRAGTFWFAQSR